MALALALAPLALALTAAPRERGPIRTPTRTAARLFAVCDDGLGHDELGLELLELLLGDGTVLVCEIEWWVVSGGWAVGGGW